MALYDPTPQVEVAPSPDFTIADVLAWARTRPADLEYGYSDSHACAVAQFGRATGRDHLVGIDALFEAYPELDRAVNPEFRSPYGTCWDLSFTYGGLVKRLETLMREQVSA